MKNESEKFKKELIEVIHRVARDKNLLQDFIHDILTHREFENISVRWQIVKRLLNRESQRTIAQDLNIGIGTVTRGSRVLLNREGGFQKVYAKQSPKKKGK